MERPGRAPYVVARPGPNPIITHTVIRSGMEDTWRAPPVCPSLAATLPPSSGIFVTETYSVNPSPDHPHDWVRRWHISHDNIHEINTWRCHAQT